MTTARVTALIINWNGAGDTIELLCSLRGAAAVTVELRAVVVDNASDDADFGRVESFVSGGAAGLPVQLIRNRTNVGVPAAYNQAIAAAGYDFDAYLRLDNDVVLPAGAIDTLLAGLAAGRGSGCGIVGGNVRYYDAPATDNGGAVTIDLAVGKTTVAYPGAVVDCDGVLGCVMLVAGDVVRAFAPDVFFAPLFLCADESELSLRARARGWRTRYLPDVIGFHKSGRSTRRAGAMAEYCTARNWAYLRLRYSVGAVARLRVLLSIAAYAALRLAQGNATYGRASLAGIGWYLRGVPSGATREPGGDRAKGGRA